CRRIQVTAPQPRSLVPGHRRDSPAAGPPLRDALPILSQAEHDAEAAAWLVTDDKHLAEAVREELARQLAALPDPAVARASLERWGLIAVCRDMEEAVLLANVLAPEHLEVMVREPLGLLRRIRHAGAV